jgi:SAM-dependent methyltransferase
VPPARATSLPVTEPAIPSGGAGRAAIAMFTEPAELYDAIYFGFKDYAAEATQIAALLQRLHSSCHTVLDVGCGTGEHARLLSTRHGFAVDGIDLNADFLRLAALKNPAALFTQADMRDFALQRRYDAVICLFSSIGYLTTLTDVTRALRRFRVHLADDGVVVVEPWFPPGVLQSGHHSTRTGKAHGIRVVRDATTVIDGRISRLQFDYAIDGPAAGETRTTTEVHELGLYTVAEMLEAFRAAGLDAKHEQADLTGRGLYVARIAA